MKVFVEGIGLRAPGIANWPAGKAVLQTLHARGVPDFQLTAPALLPPAERRRATDAVKLAIEVCSEACAHAERDPQTLASVFASSGGDGATITAILEVLAGDAPEISPTRFHNSVHNAPAGYWSIGTQSMAASTSVCAYDWSCGAGLLEAASQAASTGQPVLLALYDLRYPAPLQAARPIKDSFGIAFVLTPHETPRSLAAFALALRPRRGETITGLPEASWEALRHSNPAARALPLLRALTASRVQTVDLDYMAHSLLRITVTPLGTTVR